MVNMVQKEYVQVEQDGVATCLSLHLYTLSIEHTVCTSPNASSRFSLWFLSHLHCSTLHPFLNQTPQPQTPPPRINPRHSGLNSRHLDMASVLNLVMDGTDSPGYSINMTHNRTWISNDGMSPLSCIPRIIMARIKDIVCIGLKAHRNQQRLRGDGFMIH